MSLSQRGRTLDFTRPGDLDTICRFVASAAACGATGIGAGVNYMGPRRLHVGFGNGPHDTTQVVWGEGGAAANAPDWLRDAAQLGWAYAAGAPVPERAAPQPPSEGEAAGAGRRRKAPAASPASSMDSSARSMRPPRAPIALSAGWRAAPSLLIQLCRRSPVTGAPDAETWAILTRSALLFRVAGWLIAALGVVGLARSAGGSGPDSVLDALDRFRATLGASADPGTQFRIRLPSPDCGGGAGLPSRTSPPPLHGARSCSGSTASFRAPLGSLVALGLGLLLHRFGAKILKPLG